MAEKSFAQNAFQNRAETNIRSEEKYHAFQIFDQPTTSNPQLVGNKRGRVVFTGRHADTQIPRRRP